MAGLLVARRLAAWAARAGRADLLALEGGAAPENFTGELVRFRPELVILVDAAHLAAGPGAVEVIPAAEVQGASFSTHMLPVPIFLDYLRHMTGCRTLVLGIGLAQKDVLAPPHAEVALAVRRLTAALKRALAPVSAGARRS